jgi:anti-sigma factor (TIGR02949 family)
MPNGIEERLEYNQCQAAVRRLTEYLSHELQPQEQEAVEQHLHECRGCFARFHFEETLLRTIHDRLLEVHTPAGLRARIMADLTVAEVETPTPL